MSNTFSPAYNFEQKLIRNYISLINGCQSMNCNIFLMDIVRLLVSKTILLFTKILNQFTLQSFPKCCELS